MFLYSFQMDFAQIAFTLDDNQSITIHNSPKSHKFLKFMQSVPSSPDIHFIVRIKLLLSFSLRLLE